MVTKELLYGVSSLRKGHSNFSGLWGLITVTVCKITLIVTVLLMSVATDLDRCL